MTNKEIMSSPLLTISPITKQCKSLDLLRNYEGKSLQDGQSYSFWRNMPLVRIILKFSSPETMLDALSYLPSLFLSEFSTHYSKLFNSAHLMLDYYP
ncbi:MAG TPA: hypothetical protein VFI70_00320 [Nitrososphaeraceae archaeon]|nr:hypothetical protein [Nitrososphaeraceae archaeon]